MARNLLAIFVLSAVQAIVSQARLFPFLSANRSTEQSVLRNRKGLACETIDRVPKWVWLQVTVMSRAILMMCNVGQKMALFIQRRGCELAAECYHERHLKSLQYDIHRY